jgi:hypothetical protein
MMAKPKKKHGRIPGHTPEAEMAKRRGVEICTLQKERWLGVGQAYIKINRQVHYVDADEPRYLESLKVTPVRSRRAA